MRTDNVLKHTLAHEHTLAHAHTLLRAQSKKSNLKNVNSVSEGKMRGEEEKKVAL